MKAISLDKAIDAHIFYNVTKQVEREQAAQSSVAEHIAEVIDGLTDKDGDDIAVYQWWAVSERFASFAGKAKEVVVEAPFGTIWGRQTCGQGIGQDLNVQDIFQAMGEI